MGRAAGALTRARIGALSLPDSGAPGRRVLNPALGRTVPTAVVVVIMAAAYFGTEKLTITASDHWRVHPIWPPVGVAVAGSLIFGRRAWPGVAAGSGLIGLVQGIPADIGTTVAQTLGPLVVEVADDGIGGADPERGSGLTGLVDRVSALKGRFEIDSPPGAGTRIRAVLPGEGSAP